MDLMLVYIIGINACVAAIALVIAVAQQKFHRRVELNLGNAIEQTKQDLKKEVSAINLLVSSRFDSTERGVEEHIEQRMWQMEKRFYEKLEDPKTFPPIISAAIEGVLPKLSDHIHARFMTESKGIKKKIDDFKDQVQGVVRNGGDISDLATFDWNEDRGLVGNIFKNAGPISKMFKPLQGPDTLKQAGGVGSPAEGPPPWWGEEDQSAMEKLIQEREVLAKARSKAP